VEKSTKSEIKRIVDDIDHHLKEIDEKLDKIWQLLDSVDEEREAEVEEEEKKEDKEEEDESADIFQYGNCPRCGSPLEVLSRAPLIVECSNPKCSNRFSPKH
jgi:DNA repair exonuclease SbcCD ATPase subunit